jgi:hypothetical protein
MVEVLTLADQNRPGSVDIGSEGRGITEGEHDRGRPG